jgi:hypothetical protein
VMLQQIAVVLLDKQFAVGVNSSESPIKGLLHYSIHDARCRGLMPLSCHSWIVDLSFQLSGPIEGQEFLLYSLGIDNSWSSDITVCDLHVSFTYDMPVCF